LVALLAEVVVYSVWYGPSGRLTLFVILSNVVSSCVGVGLAYIIPTPVTEARLPEYIAWCVAFLLSVAIEYWFLVLVMGRGKLRRLLLAVTTANVVSYLAFIAMALLTPWLVKHLTK